jgi:hypothetical protein
MAAKSLVGDCVTVLGTHTVRGQDQRPASAFVDQFVEVVGLGRGELAHGEVVQDEHRRAGEFA